MRVLRAMLVLLPMLAFAGWRQIGTLTPTVTDVQVVDAGVVLGVSNGVATVWHVSDAGVVTQLNTFTSTGMVSAASYGTGCIVGLTNLGNIVASPGCGTGTALGAFNGRVIRLLTPQLGVTISSTGSFDVMHAGPGPEPGWVALGAQLAGSGTRTLQVSRIGGIDYAVANGGSGLRVSVDGGANTPVITGTLALRDAAPFPLGGAPAILGVSSTALLLLRDYRTPVPFTPSMPAGVNPRFVSMATVTGMMTTATGAVLSPIPDPNRVAEVWKVRPGPGSEWLTDKIHCLDDRYCASITDAGVVYLWENEVAPGVEVAPALVDAGQTIRLVADAGDGDGDPVFVSWTGGGGGILSAVAGLDDGTQVDFTAPTTCAPTTIDVTVTDGLPAHDRTIQVPITLNDRGAVELAASTLAPLAGGPPVAFSAGVDGGCGSTATFAWSASDGQTGSGNGFTWTPPATECNADGGQVTVTATATWSGGAPPTTALSQVVVVQPWGRPATPVFASPATQPAGSTVDYLSSGAEHACSTSNGFPGTELSWSTLLNTGDAGLAFIDGGVRITAPVTCVPLQVSLSAERQVLGEDAGRRSGAGLLTVDIPADTAPLPPTTEFAMTVQGDGGVLFGVLKVDAGCPDERGLNALVTVFRAGTFVIDGGFRPQSGGWSLPVPGGCSGGTYEVFGELYEGTRFTGASAQGSIDLLFSPARVGALSVDRVDVVCGAGARTPVSLLPEPTACGAADLTWRATGGPALVTRSGTGDTLELQSEALDFSVVGQQVALEFVADAGAGNLDVATRTIELGVQPFLEVSVKAQPPLRREEEPVSLEVTLRNTTDCAVDGLSVTLPFSGGSPILESVLLDGVRVAARSTDQGVVVDGVSVPASGSAKLRLSARARLLSSPTVEPVASLGGYVVSTLEPKAEPATGCGCSELAAPAFLGLVGLLVLRRRRRAAG